MVRKPTRDTERIGRETCGFSEVEMLLQEFWDDRYVGYCERLREVTRVGYESAWRCHVEPVFGSMELADIGVDDIELWLSGFASPGAARKAWAVLRQMLRKREVGYLEVDVTRLEIDLPAKPLYVPRLLTIGQTRRQLQGFYGHALEAWLIVDSCLALRPEEGYGVDWADIDMRSGITHIQRGVQWVAGHEVVVPPKTELSDRFLPLPRFAVRRLREIRNGRKGRIIGDLTPSQAARRYASWCKKESLPYVPVQNLRHSWATTPWKRESTSRWSASSLVTPTSRRPPDSICDRKSRLSRRPKASGTRADRAIGFPNPGGVRAVYPVRRAYGNDRW